MAVNAVFKGDFSQFTEAVKKADVALVDLEQGAGKVGKALDRMVDNFSGRKIIQDAQLMVAAIDKVGGTSSLTAKELQSAGARAQEAADKMRRMGIDVPPGLQKIATEAGNAHKSSQGFLGGLSQLNTVLGVFGASLSIGAVVNFGRELLNTADQLVKVADRTGLTTTEVQKLDYIAGQSGNTLDQMTNAVSKLQSNLAGGDKNVVRAVKDLGINFDQLRRAAPFDQMTQVATALQDIEDPAARARLAVEIFGRAGAEILPTLIADFKGLGDAAPVMSDKTVRALDQAGDSLARFGKQIKVWAAESYNALGRFFDTAVKWFFELQAGFANMLASLVEKAQKIPGVAKLMGVLGISVEDLREQARLYTDAAKAQGLQLARVDTEVRKAVTPVMDLARGTEQGAAAAKKHADELKKLHETYKALANPTRDVLFLQKDINAVIQQAAVGSLPEYIARTNDITKATIATQATLERLGQTVKEQPRVFKSLGDTMRNAFDGIAGILDNISGKFFEFAAIATRTVSSVMKNLSEGNVVGAVVAGVTGAISAIGKIFGFGKSQAQKHFEEAKQLRQEFIESFEGGFDELERRARQAGITLNALWDAKNPDAYRRAIEAINEALDFQSESMEFLNDTVRKYGFTVSELGPTFAAQQLTEQVSGLIREYTALTAAGVDHEAIIKRMGPALLDYVRSAAAAGIAIPEQMRPILESMQEQGLLTGENGESLVDLTKLTWSKTLTEQIDGLIRSLDRMVEAILRGLNPALNSIPHPPAPWQDWPAPPGVPEYPGGGGGGNDTGGGPSHGATGGLVTPNGIMQYLARGGMVWPRRGTDTVPAMLTPGERVLSVEQNKAYEAGGMSTTALESEVRMLRSQMAERDRTLPILLRDALLTMAS